ncbi:hypothetical protein M9458_024121, partial [Cirrhinus mrigala]
IRRYPMGTASSAEKPGQGSIWLPSSYAPQPDYMTGDDDLIKPKKLINPVKASKSHQELHRELLMNHKR